MDFSKVQKRRGAEQTRRRLMQIAATLFAVAMAMTLVPKIQERQVKKEVSATADDILKMLRVGNLSGAYEIGLTGSLKRQHAKSAFVGTFRHLVSRKGEIEDWKVIDFASHPKGKPYDLVTYDVQFTRGIGTVDFAMVKDGKRWLVTAYRIRATGI